VAFWGFDIQQPWYDGGRLLDYLEEIGHDDPEIIEDIELCIGVGFESREDWISTPGAWELSEGDYLACLVALRQVEIYFDQHEAELVEATSAEALAWARINLIGLRAYQQQWFAQFVEEKLAASIRARDRGMAAVFLAIKALRNPDDRVALWSHNWHVAYWAEDLEGWAPDYRIMGGFLRDALEDDYFALGLVGYEVWINWPWWYVGLLELPADELHVEHKLHLELGHEYLLVDLGFPGTDEPFLVDGGFYYVNNRWVIPADHFSALLYLDTSEMMDALLW
jgi:hypothetical protein